MRISILKELSIAALVSATLIGCESGIVPPDPVDPPPAEIVGSYDLHIWLGLPLPYHDYRTAFSIAGATLELDTLWMFEIVIDDTHGPAYLYMAGDYEVDRNTVNLSYDGEPRGEYTFSEGTLISDVGIVYIREGASVPVEYRYDEYEMVECDGEPPPPPTGACSNLATGGRMYLWARGDYDIFDTKASGHRAGTYEVDGDQIDLAGNVTDGRDVGTIEGDTLRFEAFVYVRRR